MKTKSRKKLKVAICIAVAVLLGSVAVYFFYYNPIKKAPFQQQAALDTKEPFVKEQPNYPPGYTEITMQPDDIYKGCQILINSNYQYNEELNKAFQLVNIYENKTKNLSTYKGAKSMLLESETLKNLNAMADGFYEEKKQKDLCVRSAYRSFSAQQEVMDEYIRSAGKEEAEKYVAAPGYSEHQSGLAADLVAQNADETTFSFNNYEPYSWIYENAWRYGFILRFPEDKTEITKVAAEEWHFRYVEVPHAYYMYANNYSLEEYIEFLKSTSFDEPLFINTKYESYMVYYTANLTFYVPTQRSYTVSGNNIDGFIITIEGIE